MKHLLLVACGSAIGGITRYFVSALVFQSTGGGLFPWGTLVVNVGGCFLMGIIAGMAEHLHLLSQEMRLFLMTGVLGGFTTFSAFGFETLFLLRGNHIGLAAAYVGSSLLLSFIALGSALALIELW